jgi:hypothetical protein
MQVRDQIHTPAVLARKKNHVTHWVEVWAGPRAGLDSCEENKTLCFTRGLIPCSPKRNVLAIPTTPPKAFVCSLYRLRHPKPLCARYTDYATQSLCVLAITTTPHKAFVCSLYRLRLPKRLCARYTDYATQSVCVFAIPTTPSRLAL